MPFQVRTLAYRPQTFPSEIDSSTSGRPTEVGQPRPRPQRICSTRQRHEQNRTDSALTSNPRTKQHRCPHCEKKFNSKKDLGRHMDPYQYRCTLCKHRTFTRPDNAVRHISSQHNSIHTKHRHDYIQRVEAANFTPPCTNRTASKLSRNGLNGGMYS